MSLEIKSQDHLINIIESTKDHRPNFVLFLGAGASVSSGVKNAGQMIAEWRSMYYKINKMGDVKIDDFYSKIPWAGTDQEYSQLFELLYDEPSQRREFIESCLKDASPAWGYIFLVNLLAHNVFNTIFTTNFDDLINEACYTYSTNVRPIVCAHDSSITSLRITSQRPKVIKLHGDFLYDNLKNTVRELETLEKNMLEKFRQYASEFGFIFIGYSGNDRSIMDSLNLLIKNESNFPHGIYWCLRKGEVPKDKLELVRRFPKVRLIEIDGFDEFIAELHEKLGYQLQAEMSDPYTALSIKLDGLFKRTRLPENGEINPIIKKHIDYLGKKIPSNYTDCDKEEESQINEKVNIKVPLPLGLLANINELSGNFNEAEKLVMQQLEKNKTIQSFDEALRILYKGKKLDKAQEVFDLLIESKGIILADIDSLLNISLTLISNREFEKAEKILIEGITLGTNYSIKYGEEYFYLNLLQIRQHTGEPYAYNEVEKRKLEQIEKSKDFAAVYGAKILLEKYKEAELVLKMIKEREDVNHMKDWPISKLLIKHLKNEEIFNK